MIPVEKIDAVLVRVIEWNEHCLAVRRWMRLDYVFGPNMAREYAICAKRAYDALERAIREARDESC